jgi:hypothetical protein
MANTSQTPLLRRREAFEAAHPQIMIRRVGAGTSWRWELSEPGKAAQAWDDLGALLDELEARYPNVEEHQAQR